jgi:hypothetical protein
MFALHMLNVWILLKEKIKSIKLLQCRNYFRRIYIDESLLSVWISPSDHSKMSTHVSDKQEEIN